MASEIYMYPNCYPAAVRFEWEFILAVHPLKLPIHRIGQFYSRATMRREVNGPL